MTASPYFFVFRSSMTMSRMKFEGRDSAGEFAAASIDLDEDKFVVLILLVFYMGKVDSRRLGASRRRDGRLAVQQFGGRAWRPALHQSFMANCVQCGRQLPALSFGKKLCQWCVQNEAAKRGEDTPIQRVEPAPWQKSPPSSMAVTQAIFGINVGVFVAMSLAVGVTLFGDPAWQELSVRLGANYGPYTLSGQWWRLLACVFIHGGLLHIAFNMWCLWNLGRLAESVYGHWTFALVYLITGLSASLMSVAWHFPIPVPSVGASGAIFGIAGALIASFYLGEFSMPRAAMTGMLRSVATFVAYNLFFGAVMDGNDNAAHVGGLLIDRKSVVARK